jgi:hypothetical protein
MAQFFTGSIHQYVNFVWFWFRISCNPNGTKGVYQVAGKSDPLGGAVRVCH